MNPNSESGNNNWSLLQTNPKIRQLFILPNVSEIWNIFCSFITLRFYLKFMISPQIQQGQQNFPKAIHVVAPTCLS